MNSTINSACDFNKYGPYVEKIRALFVPSLEPRIYSCLETFVYREDREALSELPCLKRCLDVAATWHEPIGAFSTHLGDCRYLEKIMAQAVKYLIKDGLIDCFINSIILNNRLNRVCRNLDAVGVEKDFLRYLAVWNYINEKDYWIDDDRKMSMSGPSYDTIESYSDLEVQIGSGLDTWRTTRCIKKSLKRRAVDDPSEVFCSDTNEVPGNSSKGNSCNKQLFSHLSIDSCNSEGFKSSIARRKPRSIGLTYPCRPSNCAINRSKMSQQVSWEGKTLKLRVCKICPRPSDCKEAKPLRLSKLSLPCKSDDVIAEIMKTDLSVPRSSFITMRKKLQAGVINTCRFTNEMLGKMSTEEVRRCRLHCEILPGFVSFKLVQRQSNGYKICLFTDRVATDKIDEQYSPREYSISQRAGNRERKELHESDVPICESTQVDLADKDSKIVSRLDAETKSKEDPQIGSSLSLPESKLDAADEQKSEEVVGEKSSNHLSGNGGNDQTCDCNPSFVDGPEYLDDKVETNLGTTRVEDSEVTADRNNSKELLGKGELAQSSGNVVDDQTCYCSNSHYKIEMLSLAPDKNRDANYIGDVEAKNNINVDKLAPEDPLNRLRRNTAEDATRRCSTQFPETLATNHNFEKNQKNNCSGCLEKNTKNFEASNRQDSNVSVIISDSHQTGCVEHQEVDTMLNGVQNNQQVAMPQSDLKGSCPQVKSSSVMEKEIQLDDAGCECPSDSCVYLNKSFDEHEEPQECDSQCFCHSCAAPIRSTSVNPLNDVSQVSPSMNHVQLPKVTSKISNPVRPTEKGRYFGTTSDVQQQSNCIESQTSSWELHNLKIHQDTSMKSNALVQPNVTNVPCLDTEVKETGLIKNSLKSLQIQTEKPTSSDIMESKNQVFLVRSPIRMDTGRPSSSKSQRINISIELYPGSESSDEKSLINEQETIASLRRSDSIRSRHAQDLSSMCMPRCHPADPRASGKRATSQSEKNTKDECLRHLRGTNTCLHSPPRPLESRDYLPTLVPPSRMRNPIVCGMSTKSNVRSTCKFERQSIGQNKRRNHRGSRYPYRNGRCCNETVVKAETNDPNELPRHLPRAAPRLDRNSSSVIRHNLCHAFSASSVDRMKHLIKTKLRRILLERDKATNTSKTSLTNEKYRVSVPNGKTRRLPFARQRCHTIWESRSAYNSARTSRTFGSTGRTSLAGISQGDELRSLFCSTTNSKILSSLHRDLDRSCECDSADNTTCYSLRNSDRSVVSSRITSRQRLIGGSDAPCRTGADSEFQYFRQHRTKSVRKIKTMEVEYVSNQSNGRSSSKSSKSSNRNCEGDSKVAGDALTKLSDSVNRVDCNDEANLNKLQDEISKYPGKLDCSGKSTSRHIYLHEYDNFEPSFDEDEKKWCDYKIAMPTINSHRTCRQSQVKRTSPRITHRRVKDVKSRPCKREFVREPTIPRNIRAPRLLSSKAHATSNVRCQKGLGKLDQDLRSKLLQYVSLCKNVKYSLLKMWRSDDIYEINGTSISCCDR